MKGGTFWNRLAAATGLDFVAIGAAIAILAQVKDVENSNDFVGLSNEVWGTYVLLLGFAAIFFLWFTSIFVARLRQVEEASGTSGRLANAVLASGSAFAGALGLCIAIQWAARMLGAEDIAVLSTAILEGPPLAFIIATYIGAAGLAVYRAGSVSAPSRIVAQLSLLVAPGYVALGGIQIFKNYAWIDETGYIAFLVWVLAVSIIGVQRWGGIDEGWEPAPDRPQEEAATLVLDEGPEPLSASERSVTSPAPRKKPAARKKPAPKQPAPKQKPGPR